MSSFEEEEKVPNEAENHLIEILNRRKSSLSHNSNSPPGSPLRANSDQDIDLNVVNSHKIRRIDSGLRILGSQEDIEEDILDFRGGEIDVQSVSEQIKKLIEKEDPVEEYKAATLEGEKNQSDVVYFYIFFFISKN